MRNVNDYIKIRKETDIDGLNLESMRETREDEEYLNYEVMKSIEAYLDTNLRKVTINLNQRMKGEIGEIQYILGYITGMYDYEYRDLEYGTLVLENHEKVLTIEDVTGDMKNEKYLNMFDKFRYDERVEVSEPTYYVIAPFNSILINEEELIETLYELVDIYSAYIDLDEFPIYLYKIK